MIELRAQYDHHDKIPLVAIVTQSGDLIAIVPNKKMTCYRSTPDQYSMDLFHIDQMNPADSNQ